MKNQLEVVSAEGHNRSAVNLLSAVALLGVE
jgi:hypothetical protein